MEDKFRIFTPLEDEQCWKKEFLKKIKKEHNVIFDGKGCHAVRIIPRKQNNPLFEVMVEDDGALFSTNLCFDMGWTDDLINVLTEAKKYVLQTKGSEQK